MKEDIREIVLSLGADLCGFAHIDQLKEAPAGFHPWDILPECKTVISFAVALPKSLTKIPSRLIYGHYNNISCGQTDLIAFEAAKKLEEHYHCVAVPLPCDVPYEYWNEEKQEGKGLVSMKHLAVQAGLGTLGKSTLLLNHRYGSMLTLGAILIDVSLPSDPPAEPVCIDGCKKCIDHCPSNALERTTVNQNACRQHAYGKTKRGFDTVDCNQCRAVCPIVTIQ